MRFVNPLPLLISLGLAAASSTSWALPSDRDQPIRVQADSAVLRDGLSTGLDLGSLVGQTALLDDRADAALQNGSFVLAQQAAGRASPAGWGAQPHVAAGQAVATVAAGVQSALPWVAEGGARPRW